MTMNCTVYTARKCITAVKDILTSLLNCVLDRLPTVLMSSIILKGFSGMNSSPAKM